MESREIQTLDHFHDDPHTVSCSDVLIDARGQEHALAAIGDPLPHLFSPSACYSSYSPSFAASSSTAAVRSTSFVASHPADETYDDDPGKPASFGTASRGVFELRDLVSGTPGSCAAGVRCGVARPSGAFRRRPRGAV